MQSKRWKMPDSQITRENHGAQNNPTILGNEWRWNQANHK